MAKASDQRLADDSEAARKAAVHAQTDPFPNVPRALLSARHIRDYVHATGMLCPFYEKSLKAASYEAHIEGEVIWWNDKGERQTAEIDREKPGFLDLEPNSITYVQIEPKFRLPHYVALRFNLRISHVHRGLLLGTGPLVDPGFEGKLLVPLHNLTSSKYHLDLSKALIWIEFTLTTYGLPPLANETPSHFPLEGKNLSPATYLQKASGGAPIISSIPDATRKAGDRAAAAEEQAKKSADSLAAIRNVGILAILTAVAGISAIVYNSMSLATTLETQMGTLTQTVQTLRKDVDATAARLEEFDKMSSRMSDAGLDLRSQGRDVASLGSRLDDLSHRLDAVSAQIGSGSKGTMKASTGGNGAGRSGSRARRPHDRE